MIGRNHQLNGHEFEQAPGIDKVCCSPRDREELDLTE